MNDVVPTTSMMQTASYVIAQWGSAVALALFGLWAFWSLNKTVRSQAENSLPDFDDDDDDDTEPEEEEELFDDLTPEGDTKRIDQFQHLVKNDPDMTASIISNWIQNAK